MSAPDKKPLVPTKQMVADPLTMQELTRLLIKHYDLHEGKFDLSMELQIGVGAVGPDPTSPLPGAFFGVSKVGLSKVDKDGPATVDAAIINPRLSAKKAAAKPRSAK